MSATISVKDESTAPYALRSSHLQSFPLTDCHLFPPSLAIVEPEPVCVPGGKLRARGQLRKPPPWGRNLQLQWHVGALRDTRGPSGQPGGPALQRQPAEAAAAHGPGGGGQVCNNVVW